MKGSTPIIFFGTGSFSAPALEALIEAGWEIAVVITKPDSPAGRGQKLSAPVIKTIAHDYKIPVWQPDNPAEIVPDLKALNPAAGVAVAYGKMLPLEAIKLFPHQNLLNIHASLLPKYRGASPIEAAILNGDHETGVSLMRISLKMDQGPVFAQAKMQLTGQETKPVLYDQLSRLGAQLLADKLPDVVSGKLKAKAQDDTKATYVKLIQKSDGEIDWSLPAVQIERQIRAYLGWPGSRTKLAGKEVIITAAHIGDGDLTMVCGDGQILAIDRLKPTGKTEMSGAEFKRWQT